MNGRSLGLRARLALGAVAGAAITLAVILVAFNIVLDARLRTDADNLLRERAATVLRGLGIVDGRLRLIEAPDKAAIDAQTWIFAGGRTLEQPAGADPRDQAATVALALAAPGFATVEATHTRLHALPVRERAARLGTVVVGASLTPYESTASSALLGSIVLGVVTLAAIAALSLRLIRRALRPVARMTAQAADWSEHDLSRRFYAGEPHDELSRLASVFDALLARLAESIRREQHLTAEVSHELRTPLAKIQAEAELSSSRERPAEAYRSSLREITRHANELQLVLETLLASARAALSAGSSASDAREPAERAAAIARETAAAAGKTIEVLAGRPARVAVAAEVVERILAPLLENAARFANRRVELEIRPLEGEVLYEIRDDGPGVAPADRERIFAPGITVDPGRATTHGGAGLGLPLARRLAGAAGGEVAALESAEGGRFAVRLPRG